MAVDVAREGDDTSPGGATSGFPQTPSSADDVVGLATRTPTSINTPSATVPQQVVTPTWTIYELSRAGQVEIVLEDGVNAYTIASVDPETSQHELWDIEFVADVNADGVDDAIVRYFTGGAHCCFEYLVFSEAPEGIHLDDWFSIGNATVADVVDLDGDGVPELQTRDDRLAYFPDLCYACSPFLPLVLCRSAQAAYYDCTPQFPQLLESSAQAFEGQLRKAIQEQLGEYETRSSALGLLASHLRMGLALEGWSSVEGLCPECKAWLLENSSDLQERLNWVQPYRSE
jgi:hypothetical protein